MVEFFGDGETEAMLDLLGVTVTIGGSLSTKALMNYPGAVLQKRDAPGTVAAAVVAVVRTKAIGAAKVGDTVVAESASYVIRRRIAIEDGGLTELHLANAV